LSAYAARLVQQRSAEPGLPVTSQFSSLLHAGEESCILTTLIMANISGVDDHWRILQPSGGQWTLAEATRLWLMNAQDWEAQRKT
jgi:hypothetical protein